MVVDYVVVSLKKECDGFWEKEGWNAFDEDFESFMKEFSIE